MSNSIDKRTEIEERNRDLKVQIERINILGKGLSEFEVKFMKSIQTQINSGRTWNVDGNSGYILSGAQMETLTNIHDRRTK